MPKNAIWWKLKKLNKKLKLCKLMLAFIQESNV